MQENEMVKVEIDGRKLLVPSFMVCPLTLDVMRWPVVNVEGYNFEKTAILRWLVESNRTCPLTRKPAKPSDFISNYTLRTQIQGWKRKNGLSTDDEKEEFVNETTSASLLVSDAAVEKFLRYYAAEHNSVSQSAITAQDCDGLARHGRCKLQFNWFRRQSKDA